MPLEESAVARERLHTRQIKVEGYRREDGLWDIEASLLDEKDHDLGLVSSVRRAGEAVHCMRLRWTLDSSLTILAVDVAMDALPYTGVCDTIKNRYEQLVGLRVGAGFKRAVGERFRGVNGCSHMTELVGAMAAGSVQTLAPYLNRDAETRPLQIGGCHAWAEDGALVKAHYPAWFDGATTR
ncbi:hypothetical protein NOV72_05409 [Caballeronia novacaledonica]|uniref:DUF2889 domain-containing protein n=1 Tax=Caballeronia novacaledonica TaxID=1544861 RepID=A0A2U3IDJ4_9BURK|nr:DUF2889 domain-containing protein [Caballeronia novacaledonica]SPB18210.1 hypothetical protein NOV72_05409 [Caballeronia novacaledonica]